MCACFLVGCIQIIWCLSTYCDAHAFHFFPWLIMFVVDVSTCFFEFPRTPFIPPNYWVISANAWKGKVLKVEVQRRRRGQKGCRKGKDKEQRARISMNHSMNEWKFHCGL